MSPANENGPFPLREQPLDDCPFCGVSLIGDRIPADLLATGWYGGSTHWRREIGVEQPEYDGVIAEVCPDCLMAWPYFTGGGRLTRLGEQYVAEHNDRVVRVVALVRAEMPEHIPSIDSLLAKDGLRPVSWMYDPVNDVVRIDCEPVQTGGVDRAHLNALITNLVGREASVASLPAPDAVDASSPWWRRVPSNPWPRG